MVGQAKPQYFLRILQAFQEADPSKYKDSMRSLIEKDIEEAIKSMNLVQNA